MPYDAIIYQAGERGDLQDAAGRAREFVTVAKMQPGVPLTVSIGGYDDDPRELFDVPEVMAFLRDFVGYMGQELPGAQIATVFKRFSYECRALMFLAAGITRREDINITDQGQEGSVFR